MSAWIRVEKSVYREMEASGKVCYHGFTVDGEQVGYMEVIDHDEDCLWFDYYVCANYYKAWSKSSLTAT